MSENKNKFKFDDFNLNDINFSEIGNSIKKSVNSTLKKFTEATETENLPQTRNKEVCAQKPPEISKAHTFQALTILSAIGLTIVFFYFLFSFFSFKGFGNFFGSIFTLLLTIAIPYVFWKASKEYLRLSNNYIRFLRELGNNTVISIRDLASSVTQSEEKTVSDLTKMMKRGYFYQARIVEDDSLFILDIPTFRLYKEKKKEIPQTSRNEDNIENNEELVEDLSYEKASEILKKGNDILARINKTKANIKSEDFKSNVEKVSHNSTDILRIVENHPEKSYALNKFSDYYLPTVEKLTDTYYEFELMRTDDSRIKKSMHDINESIITITEAFDKIKVELLGDRAMDIKTDIDTINLLLNQEGYTEDDWSKE
ncbi:5-bromo-4-chloroindolyl phosphate hydrolysis family protein [Anaerococcus nagyae]|uniref:5-bromo-4-chloroindolyl phosphate hydrolysis family protein n=1 Tax=Anaerococcus nagyae TaxID=1755241 RepID=UPI003247043C